MEYARLSTCTCKQGAESIFTLINRLALTRDEAPASPQSLLLELCCCMLEGDMLSADAKYHALHRSLLACPARRVSGSLFTDYLLYLVVQKPNAFSRLAAAQHADEELALAMYRDLQYLGELSTLSSADVMRMAQDGYREAKQRPRHARERDSISLMSTAVWSLGSAQGKRPLPRAEQDYDALNTAVPPMDMDWADWRYGDAGLSDEHASDEAGEEMYLRLLSNRSWAGFRDDLWNFFAAYGCGEFLCSRLFAYDGSALAPLSANVPAAPDSGLYEAERAQVTDNVIRFMRDERACNMLIAGEAGVGKSTLVRSLPFELPEVRLIYAQPGADLTRLTAKLRAQPLKFIVLFDGVDAVQDGVNALRHSLSTLSAAGQPDNVLLCCTLRSGAPDSSEHGALSAFSLQVYLPCLQLGRFSDLVKELAELEGIIIDVGELRERCIDHQVDTRDRLTYAGALKVVSQLGE